MWELRACLECACGTAAPADAAMAACSAKNPRLSIDGRDGAFNGKSRGGTALSVHTARPACTLLAQPVLTFYDAKGGRVPTRFDQSAVAPAVPLVAGGCDWVEAELRWVRSPCYRRCRKVRVAGVHVRLPVNSSLDAVQAMFICQIDPQLKTYLLRRRNDANASKPKPIKARLPGSGTRAQLAEVIGPPAAVLPS